MSRWLRSVNNLLETLDGTAETVAEAVATGEEDYHDDDGDNNNNFTTNMIQSSSSRRMLGTLMAGIQTVTDPTTEIMDANDDDDYDDDDDGDGDEYYVHGEDVLAPKEDEIVDEAGYENDAMEDEEEEEEEEEERLDDTQQGNPNGHQEEEEDDGVFYEEIVDDDQMHRQVSTDFASSEEEDSALLDSSDEDYQSKEHPLNDDIKDDDGGDEEDAISIEMRQRPSRSGKYDVDPVSDISFSEYDDEEFYEEVVEGNIVEGSDVPPRTPNRQVSEQDSLPIVTEAEIEELQGEQQQQSKSKDGNKDRQLGSSTNGSGDNKSNSNSADSSPILPRRSIDDHEGLIAPAGKGFLDDEPDGDDDDDVVGAGVAKSKKTNNANNVMQRSIHSMSMEGSDPPKRPERQSSLPISPSEHKEQTKTVNLQGAQGIPGADSKPKVKQDTTAETAKADKKPESNRLPPRSKATNNTASNAQMQKLMSKVQSLQTQLKAANNDLRISQQQANQLRKQNKTLTAQLATADAEIAAQRDELERAGERMEKDRQRAEEDREDLMDDHDEEMEELKTKHAAEISKLRKQYEAKIQTLEEQVTVEEQKRMQEGGDWTKELEEAIQREREAIKKCNAVEAEKRELEITMSELERDRNDLQAKYESASQSAKTATERERQAEDKLDAEIASHARQLNQRQAREVELEQTILELGAALSASRQVSSSTGPSTGETMSSNSAQQFLSPSPVTQRNSSDMDEMKLKELYEVAKEELDAVKVQLEIEVQRRSALQNELNEFSIERAQEEAAVLERQRQQDQIISDMAATITRLEAIIKANGQSTNNNSITLNGRNQENDRRVSQLLQELEQSKTETANLSEQLMRQQGRAETSKAEILALKGRLESALARAGEAEKSLNNAVTANSTGRMYEMEGGQLGYSSKTPMRRRIKGGSAAAARLRSGSSVRSIRSALQIGPGRLSSNMEQVGVTIDAIDSWMIETGSFLRHEPLGRLAFFLYLMTLHLWSFALVVFHTTEQPHGDFGSMGSNPRHWRP